MRSLSGRLVTAQEEERRRLARELHDDVSQRLARLAIDVGRIERETPDGSQVEALRQVGAGLATVSEDIHALSYRLHPSLLEDLGLVEALEVECERFSDRAGFQAAVPVGPGVAGSAAISNRNRLIEIGKGFNNATANLYMSAQLAPGVRVQLTSYLSSRHHNETWVKDGFIQIDESPIDFDMLNTLMKYTTVKIGHFEVNYRDMHYRRSDNGQAIYNPFVGNSIMDAFTTEVGAEVVWQYNGFLAVGAITNGEIRGNLARPDDRDPAHMIKKLRIF